MAGKPPFISLLTRQGTIAVAEHTPIVRPAAVPVNGYAVYLPLIPQEP